MGARLSVHAELIPRTGRRLPAPRTFVTHIAPQPCDLGLSGLALGLHLDGGVVSKEGWSSPHQFTDVVGQGLEQGRGSPNPIGERGAMQVDLVTGIYPGLSIKWQVIAIFADQHMGQ